MSSSSATTEPASAKPGFARRFVRRFAVTGPVQEPSRARVLTVIAIALLLHLAIMLVVRESPSGQGVVGAIVLAALSGLIVGSTAEWLVHRYVMHHPSRFRLLRMVFDLHHRGHHHVHYTPDRYVHAGPVNYVPVFPPRPDRLCDTNASRSASMLAQLGFYLLIAIPIVPLPAWLLTGHATYTVTFTVITVLECWLFVRVHDLVHHPEVGWLRRLPGFRHLDHHHYIHHIDTRANTNFLLPLGDVVFGTWRVSLTETEQSRWPEFELARSSLVDPKRESADEPDALTHT